eukprot:123211-Chlamydomonas_euryale.AAC.4
MSMCAEATIMPEHRFESMLCVKAAGTLKQDAESSIIHFDVTSRPIRTFVPGLWNAPSDGALKAR